MISQNLFFARIRRRHNMRRTLSAAYTPRTQAYPPVSAYVRVCPPHCPPRTMSEADKKVRRGLRRGVRQSARIRADTPRTLTYPPRIGGQSAADCPWKSPPRTMSAAWRHSDNIRRGQCTPRTMSAAYESSPRTMSAAYIVRLCLPVSASVRLHYCH